MLFTFPSLTLMSDPFDFFTLKEKTAKFLKTNYFYNIKLYMLCSISLIVIKVQIIFR